MKTSTAMILPQINDLIGCMKENNRAARAARFWCNFLAWSATASSGRLRQKIDIFKSYMSLPTTTRARSSESSLP